MERYQVIRKIGTGSYGSAYLVCPKAMPSVQLVLKKIKLEGDEKVSSLAFRFRQRFYYFDHVSCWSLQPGAEENSGACEGMAACLPASSNL